MFYLLLVFGPPNPIENWRCSALNGCFLKWWYPQNTPKWSFLVGKPMVVGYHHFRKPPNGWNKPFLHEQLLGSIWMFSLKHGCLVWWTAELTWKKSSSWWFQIFLFSALPGEDSPFDDHIFQMGWNHQLVMIERLGPEMFSSFFSNARQICSKT